MREEARRELAGARAQAQAQAQAGAGAGDAAPPALLRDYEGELLPASRAAHAPERLRAVYDSFLGQFVDRGLDVDFVASQRPHYGGLREDSDGGKSVPLPWPREYVKMPGAPFPRNAVRLVVAPLVQAGDPGAGPLVARLARLCASFQGLLRSHSPAAAPAESFANPRQKLHVTLFFLSHPHDPRPDPFDPAGGLPSPGVPPASRPPPRDDTVVREVAAFRALSMDGVVRGFALVVDRVVFTRTGTLLVLWTERGGEQVATLRAAARHHLPGAPAKQPDILHSTLVRVLTAEQMGEPARADVAAFCERATAELRGQTLHVRDLWYVQEFLYSCIEGETTRVRLADADAGGG